MSASRRQGRASRLGPVPNRRPNAWLRGLVGLSVLMAAVGCGAPEAEVGLLQIPAPQALDSCANPPTLQAELWVSGSSDPCSLDVDASGAASGSCQVPARAERTLTVDWFVTDTFNGNPVRVLMAQAMNTVDLITPPSDSTALEIAASDIVVRGCVDVTGEDKVNGTPTIMFDGQAVPPCDLDASCPAGSDDEACSNLGEVCAGGDPFDSAL